MKILKYVGIVGIFSSSLYATEAMNFGSFTAPNMQGDPEYQNQGDIWLDTTGAGGVFKGYTGGSVVSFGNVGPATSSDYGTVKVGQIPGSATNDTAPVGSIGEYVASTGSATTLVSGSTVQAHSYTLSAGDWDVWGSASFDETSAPDGAFRANGLGISTTSGALVTGASDIRTVRLSSSLVLSRIFLSPIRISLASPTTVYLNAYFYNISGTGASSPVANNPTIYARRAR